MTVFLPSLLSIYVSLVDGGVGWGGGEARDDVPRAVGGRGRGETRDEIFLQTVGDCAMTTCNY